jgi:predicted ATPase/DNA-binding SARP family transcriptional activator
MVHGASLGIRLFGGFEVLVGGEPIGRVRSRSVEWLLALLVLRHGRGVPRSWLAGLLWPESAQDQALINLRRNLMDLRRALGPAADRLRSPTRDSLRLDLTEAEADVVTFDRVIAVGDDASLARAVSLHRGPLLEGWAEEWVLPERESRAEACLQALETLADRAAQRGEHAEAEVYLCRAEAIDPLRDATQRRLMEVLAARGDTPAAILTFREYRLRLHREMAVDPDPETTRLFQELRSGVRRTTLRRPRTNGAASDLRLAPDRGPLQRPPGEPPPLRAAAPLPRPLTALIGREAAVGKVVQALTSSRLVTLAGEGGVGKTRLALQVAEELLESFDEEVAFVELAPLADPSLVAASVAEALGIREGAEGTPDPGSRVRSVIARLGSSPVLLVLDNCDHVIEAVAALAATLLAAFPELRVLATSRQRLGLTGEVVWRVPPLPSPDSDTVPSDGGRSTARERHQTLRALIDWSYDLLTEAERALLRRLSVFSGGWSLDAAEGVCGVDRRPMTNDPQRMSHAGRGLWVVGRDDVLDLLISLVEKSLVVSEVRAGENRYWMLETVREYAREKLQETGEEGAARREHATYFRAMADEAFTAMCRSEGAAWLELLEREHDNLRAALAWSQSAGGDLELAVALGGALGWFWIARGYLTEGRERLERLVALAPAPQPSPGPPSPPRGHDPRFTRARLLTYAGTLAHHQGDYEAARGHFQESLTL